MSQIALSSNAAGTGTFTLASPATNTDRTLTLPDNSGTVITTASTFAGTGPAFSAFAPTNAQSFASTVFTKIQYSSEEFDLGSCYDSATNYRFTPNVAGYYQVNAVVGYVNHPTGICIVSLFKNGVRFRDGNIIPNSNQGPLCVASALIYFNGSTDYVEVFGFQTSGGTLGVSVNAGTAGFFQASMVRAA